MHACPAMRRALSRRDLKRQPLTQPPFVPIVFFGGGADTYTLFPETVSFLHEVEEHYGFKADVYHAKGIETQADYDRQFRATHFDSAGNLKQDQIKTYDELCKVEPLNRAIEANKSECWINGRRRDHGDMRATLSVWEGGKLNPLAFWSFEDCWLYLRRNNVPYHPLHDVGYASLGDKHSTIKVANEKWMLYKGERSGRFVGKRSSSSRVLTVLKMCCLRYLLLCSCAVVARSI